MFSRLFGRKKIQVEFIDSKTGELISSAEMLPEQLPDSFELSTNFTLRNQEYTVVETTPTHSKDFKVSKTLKIKLAKIEKINPKDLLYTLPTISNELPGIGDDSAFTDFRKTFHEDDWRQREFLKKSSFPLVEIEIKGIQEIWDNHKQPVDAKFNAFDKLHVRSTIGLPVLNISLKNLQECLKVDKIGSAFIDRQGFVKNGFALETSNTVYLGLVIDGSVLELCLLTFNDKSIEEIEAINNQFNLIFVDWYHHNIIAENEY